VLLKVGRDSAWPLKITVASALDETTSLSITYDSDWEECDETMDNNNIYAGGPDRVPSSQSSTPVRRLDGEAPPCDPV
jgi:hypothetical protein